MEATINGVLSNLQGVLTGIAVTACALMIGWGGFRYMTALSPRDREEAVGTIRGACVGLLIVFAANIIATTVRGFVGG